MATAVTGADQRLYKVAEVAARLGVSKTKIWELLARGDLPSVKIDGARRVTHAQLAAYITRLEGGAPDA